MPKINHILSEMLRLRLRLPAVSPLVLLWFTSPGLPADKDIRGGSALTTRLLWGLKPLLMIENADSYLRGPGASIRWAGDSF